VRVELTTRLAKSRIAGFEGREGHRTPFASAKSIVVRRNISQATAPYTRVWPSFAQFLSSGVLRKFVLEKVLSPSGHGHRYGNLRRSNQGRH